MKDWQDKLDDFLRFNERHVLGGAGKVSKKKADEFAKSEYDRFEVVRRNAIETQAEQDYIKQLEDAAKQLPTTKDRPDNEKEK